ncbi:KUP/HAK/KT family potassium transporter [uncultured Thiodictyon sp.]|uniref:potassium transporter Kup n=1 Tax=uncultured Thiodictyon sp. TaxID=1846217 RepID=UPI0025DD02A0|nr:KUP/HAK/KT family potassium transporter [uncultured Thiodictyon sp.]
MSTSTANPSATRGRLGLLSLAALGVVFGDIGTSPLYAIQAVFANDRHPVPVEPGNVLGILSLVFWSLAIIVWLKYVMLILRADNRGEGGIMALIALVRRRVGNRPAGKRMIVLGLFGAALFYGDGVITPAISVLSAVEGLKILTPKLNDWVLPTTLGILFTLFAVQRHGTARVGTWFGPIMVVWFFTIGLLGIRGIAGEPGVLAALSPTYALAFLAAHPRLAFFSLGSVVLAVTGTEALYADMGHFGCQPIRLAWGVLVMPALVLNYFGQGALLLSQPLVVANPFFRLAPDWALAPLVVLATIATVIASQAVISGAFSLTRQAIQLGYLPRMAVQHTSSKERGQIYVPAVNWALFIAVTALVLGFGSSDALAAAYGIAVTGTMSITTILVFVVARWRWRWGTTRTFLVLGSFLGIDLAFFGANLPKLSDGGWFPLAFAAVVFLLMSTWKRGRAMLIEHLAKDCMPLATFAPLIEAEAIPTVSGTAVYLSARPGQVPHSMLHCLKHFKCLHERVVILHVAVTSEPHVALDKRVHIEPISARFYQVRINFGFMDKPSVADAIAACQHQGVSCDPESTTFFARTRDTPAEQGCPDVDLETEIVCRLVPQCQ